MTCANCQATIDVYYLGTFWEEKFDGGFLPSRFLPRRPTGTDNLWSDEFSIVCGPCYVFLTQVRRLVE